jgi:ABC-type dipeptide/oligopeptide/nickel transport system ATPase component
MVEDIQKILYQPAVNKTFFIISSSSMGYELRAANIKDFDIPIELNYGESFVEKYENIVGKLKNNKHGLFLFHGESGCGKTMILRKLVSELADDKTIIYVPSYFMFDIANPELISFISKFKNSVLLLEDAESILTASQDERNQAVSNILNISDGLLNDHMDMQIIATFNVERKIIDSALLRKGRLMVDYKFKKLTSKQATKLSKYIGLNKEYTEPKSLAEIYEEKSGGKQLIDNDVNTQKIGFQFTKNE